jgi:MoaA/NifB/PqqE/SkfB family radical SAM enzyme
METPAILDMLDQAAGAGFVAYVAFGGEPLLHDDIIRILTHARARGLYTILITNGGRLLEKSVELAGCTDLTIVSLDDTGTAHDTLRGQEGLFSSACAGIAAMRERGARVVLNCVISRFSPGAEQRMLAFAEKSGLKIAFDPMEPFPGINDEGVLTTEDAQRVFWFLMEKRREGRPILNSARFLEHQVAPAAFSCAQPRIFLRVAEDGTVRPFWCRKQIGLRGDLKTQSLLDIITSPAWKEFDAAAQGCHACTNSSTVESSLFYSAGFWASRRYIRFAFDYAL